MAFFYHELTAGDPLTGHAHRLVEVATGVIAQVEHKLLDMIRGARERIGERGGARPAPVDRGPGAEPRWAW